MKKIILIIVLFLSINCIYTNEIENIYRESSESIVLIITYDQNNVPLSLGSGFYIEKNLIATNFHVINNANKIVIKNLGTQESNDGLKIKSYSEELDIAILQTDNYNSTYLNITDKLPNIGEDIVAIGNPKGLEGTVSTGIVSGIRDLNDEYKLIQITSPISPGSSGGPILNMSGDVIGVSTYTLLDSQNLNFAVSTSAINFLKTKNIKWEPQVMHTINLDNFGSDVELSYFEKKFAEFYENFSLKNNTNYNIKNIIGILEYFDENNNAISYQIVINEDTIPPGMAKLKKIKSFDQSQNFVFKYGKSSDHSKKNNQQFTVSFRLLDYEIIEDNVLNSLLGI